MRLCNVRVGDWATCGKGRARKARLVVGKRTDGYVRTSDGLFWRPEDLREPSVGRILDARDEAEAVFAAEWKLEAREEAARRRLVPPASMEECERLMRKGMTPVQAAVAYGKAAKAGRRAA